MSTLYMTTSKNQETVSALFQESANDIDTIFTSFRELHTIYSSSFTNIEKNLDGLPDVYRKQIDNVHKAFKNTSGTVEKRQLKISNQLYTQALVLLVGNAESLTKEMFRTLLRSNVRKVTIKKKIDIPLSDVLKADTDEKLANLVLSILELDGNPAEKLNFQNMQQLQGIMNGYLGINIDDELIKSLHEYWQIRHIVIHNASIIDQKFIDNLKKANIPISRYPLGKNVIVTKKDYDNCFGLLVLLFEVFDNEIDRLKLAYNTV